MVRCRITSTHMSNELLYPCHFKVSVNHVYWSVQWAGQKQHADGTATITSVEPTVKGKVKLNDSTEFDNPYKWRFSDKLHKVVLRVIPSLFVLRKPCF